MAHIRQSRPDFGVGFHVKVLETSTVILSSLGSGPTDVLLLLQRRGIPHSSRLTTPAKMRLWLRKWSPLSHSLTLSLSHSISLSLTHTSGPEGQLARALRGTWMSGFPSLSGGPQAISCSLSAQEHGRESLFLLKYTVTNLSF